MRKLILIAILFSFTVLHSQPPNTGMMKSSTAREVRINFSLAAVSVSTYNNLFGQPKTGVRSLTNMNDINGIATDWDITTVATANWRDSVFTVSATDGIAGMTAMSFFTGATSGVYANAYYQYGSLSPGGYDAALHQFLVSGLNPNKFYEIKITGADGTYTFDANPSRYTVTGLTTPASQDVDGNVTSQSNGATFTIQPATDGTIKVWMNCVPGSSNLNMAQGMIIKQL